MVYIPGLGESSFPGGKAGIPGPAGADGATGSNGYGVSTADGRLTTVSGTPILTSNQLAKTTLYYTPFKGNQIAVYNGSTWVVLTFAETSLSLSGYTASRNYDIWGYSNNGTFALDSTVWTNDTTRATALTTQDGVYVKSGDATRRYLGTVRINSTGGQIDWSFGSSGSGPVEAKAMIWNQDNQVLFQFRSLENTTSWTHANNSTWSSLNGSSAARFSFVNGDATSAINAYVAVRGSSGAAGAGAVAVGLDSTSSPLANQIIIPTPNSSIIAGIRSEAKGIQSVGYHYLQAIEYSTGNTSTFYGFQSPYTQSGLMAEGWF